MRLFKRQNWRILLVGRHYKVQVMFLLSQLRKSTFGEKDRVCSLPDDLSAENKTHSGLALAGQRLQKTPNI